ncbi:MAG: DUF1538 domain-containing protein [Clostridia bacterium]|nr:DUF1538 domain-containing protein [Clostridia bacterium]
MNLIKQKLHESFMSVFPIAAIVLALSMIVIDDFSAGYMVLFLIGAVFLVLGMSLFTLGAEMSMQPLGSKIGSAMAKSGRIWLIAFISFVIGIAITVSEPDLQILAGQIYDDASAKMLLILTVSVGVGIFLIIAVLRIIFGVNLSIILAVFYIAAMTLSFFLPRGFQPLAFDSGGVTTGPMTVPFIMSLGAGVSAARRNKEGAADSFGITALCSIGPIIAVLVLGILTGTSNIEYPLSEFTSTIAESEIANTKDGLLMYIEGFGDYAGEVALALLPIVIFTALFQIASRSFTKKQMVRLTVGVLYTFLGLAVFLTGANVGFLPTGFTIGEELALVAMPAPGEYSVGGVILIVFIAMLLGFFIVKVEPAVYVLNHLVEEMSAGAISAKITGRGLSVGVASALGLAIIRILTGINIMYILIPGYVIALVLCFFVPKMFVGIAYDSGGVASGTMMSAFVLPLCIGACSVISAADAQTAIMTDAFGCVAFVAMAPIITIQITGLIYSIKSKRRKQSFISKSETFVEYPRRAR